jgi:acylphosphatase
MPARRWVVAGRVQGVGFRWFVARHAQALGLDGVARNLADGSVEIVAAGPDAALDELETALRKGPAMASVDRVDRHEASLEDIGRKGFHTS